MRARFSYTSVARLQADRLRALGLRTSHLQTA
jgi:hypothetical protein